MQRHVRLLLLLSLSLVWNACSHGSGTTGSSSTAPTAAGALGLSSRLTSRALDLAFPPRNEPFDFRKQLEAQYQTVLKRTATSTFVDTEGDIVWTEEYLRYRVNGCDHPTAIKNVLTEINGSPAPAVCGVAISVAFPPRNDSLDFRKQLEIQYQTVLRRTAGSTFVDIEGDSVWTQEYLRYRLNACDHSTAVADVFTQINGATAPAVCGCVFTISPTSQTVPAAGGNFSVQLTRTAGSCAWTATADSFVTLTASSGADPTGVTYSVAANNGAARTGTITISWSGGSTRLAITQAASPVTAGFFMTDPSSQAGATTECRLRGASSGTPTTCTFTSTSFAQGTSTITNYQWTATYTYDALTTVTQAGTSPTFAITDSCGGVASSNAGAVGVLSVTLTITDSAGNIGTVTSGLTPQQPDLFMRFYTCGS